MSSDTTTAAVPALHSSIEGAVGTVTIDNVAKHNALSFDMWQSFPAVVQALDADERVRVIVLQGAGERAFASGSDISQFGERRNTPEGVALYNRTVDQAIASIGAASKPTVAKIDGYCFGGGAAIAIHCDLRYATAASTFSIPAGKVGVGYHELWLQRLTWLVGPANAKEIMFTAGRYDAARAERMGLVNEVLDKAAIDEKVRTIASLAPLTHLASKLAINTAVVAAEAGRAACQAAILRCFSSADYIEGRDAFTQKRVPQFKGV